jgi:hypothetical protein
MLAQLVEQRTFNPFVVGSTPAHPTIFLKARSLPIGLFYLPSRKLATVLVPKIALQVVTFRVSRKQHVCHTLLPER